MALSLAEFTKATLEYESELADKDTNLRSQEFARRQIARDNPKETGIHQGRYTSQEVSRTGTQRNRRPGQRVRALVVELTTREDFLVGRWR